MRQSAGLLPKILLGVGVIVLLIAAFVLNLLIDGGMFRDIHPHFDGSCTRVEGVVGAEDITYDAESGFAYISSHDRRTWMRTGKAEGGIYRYRAGAYAHPLEIPHDYDGVFHPHGIGLWKNPAGPDRLFVVNHPDGGEGGGEAGADMSESRSEVLVFDVNEDHLHHVRTVRAEEGFSLNDVVPDGEDSFYASIDMGSTTPLGRTIEMFVRLPRGGIARGNAFGIWRVESGLTYPNGLALTPDGAHLIVAETTGGRLLAYRRDGKDGSRLTRVAEKHAGTASDNIERAADGSFWIGAHPVPLAFPGHKKAAENRSPSQVLRVTFDGAAFTVEEIYLNDGDPLSGSSVAAPVSDHLLIGSVFEPFFLDCTRAPAP